MARKRPGLVRPLIKLAAAAAIGYAASDPRVAKADRIAFKQIRSRSNETMNRVLPIATDLGSMYAAAGVGAALLALGHRKLAIKAVGAAATAWGVAQASKRLYSRPRPYHDDDQTNVLVREPAGLSYPSGHPAVAAALAAVLAPEARAARSFIERIPRLVAASRVYVGVHYPTDVIGGTMLGDAVGDLWRRYGS
ncbi:MAG: phosphatase PAP2 family protein [Actinomycetota bacterium]